jgi:hypothetical protein
VVKSKKSAANRSPFDKNRIDMVPNLNSGLGATDGMAPLFAQEMIRSPYQWNKLN